jgi:hypothetical protein
MLLSKSLYKIEDKEKRKKMLLDNRQPFMNRMGFSPCGYLTEPPSCLSRRSGSEDGSVAEPAAIFVFPSTTYILMTCAIVTLDKAGR